MAGPYDKQAKEYLDSRPGYPASLFSMLASLTANHQLAWDVGAGNGQASVSIAEHYDRVIATDISKGQLDLARKHPKVTYALTPPVMMDEELFSTVGEEGSVDLVAVAAAVHWFDLDTFYSQGKRVLRKPGSVIAVWFYGTGSVSPAVDTVCAEFLESTIPYRLPKMETDMLKDGHRKLPFPFAPVLENGGGSEGNPLVMETDIEMSLEKFLLWYNSSPTVVTAREKGVDLLNETVLRRFKEAWGDESKIYTYKMPLYVLAGTLSL